MSTKVYNWERFWCPRNGRYAADDDGFLIKPDEHQLPSTDAVHFADIAATQCLVLMGEPGIGKSQCFQEAYTHELDSAQPSDITILHDLRSFGSEDRLIRAVFESPAIENWKTGTGTLSLFLDSLDEALLRIDVLAALLPEQLKAFPTERFRLRIACRTADWPQTLEHGLVEKFTNDKFGAFELLALSRPDAAVAALAEGIDSDAFLSELSGKGVGPLAIKPVTLRFLLQTFSRDASLPATRTALYEKGLRILCEESNQFRRDAGLVGLKGPDARMEIAGRLAITVLSNRFAIWTGPESAPVPEEDVIVRQLAGGMESVQHQALAVDEESILDTLGTGLFSSRGPHRLGWAHQTYGEFLASRYIVRHEMPLDQVLSLLVNSSDPEKKVVPQLREVAAWLGTMRDDIFDDLAARDPEVLLSGDVANSTPGRRQKLLSALLDLHANEKLLVSDSTSPRHYGRLKYDGIASDLREFILNPTLNVRARTVAVDIASASAFHELGEDLLALALDKTVPILLRDHATAAIGANGDAQARRELRPLAITPATEDPHDELRGRALLALWPDLLTPDEVFSLISPPHHEHLFGMYKWFLHDALLNKLPTSGFAAALAWVASEQQKGRPGFDFARVANEVMFRAWDELDSKPLLKLYAAAVVIRLRSHDEIVGGEHRKAFLVKLESDTMRRRALVEQLLMLLDDEKIVYSLLGSAYLIRPDDLEWLVGLLPKMSGIPKDAVAQSILRVFNVESAEDIALVIGAANGCEILRQKLKPWLDPVDIRSPEADEMRTQYHDRLEWELETHRKSRLLQPPPTERVERLLTEAENGDIDAWWKLVLDLDLKPDSTTYENEHHPNLTDLAGWQTASGETRLRIVAAARKYVLSRQPETERWLGKDQRFRPDEAAYRALRLLLIADPGFVRGLGRDIWAKWIPITLAFETWNDAEEKAASKTLACLGYLSAPDDTLTALGQLLRTLHKEGRHSSVYDRLVPCWDERIGAVVLGELRRRGLPVSGFQQMLSFLIDKGMEEAIIYAQSLVHAPISKSTHTRAKAVIAASLLITKGDPASWPLLWKSVTRDTEFAKDVIAGVAGVSQLSNHVFLGNLEESQLADWYLWIHAHWPQHEDPLAEGRARNLGPIDSILEFRDDLLRNLQYRGTFAAGHAVTRLSHALPELEWLKWTVQATFANARRQSWLPASPEQVLALAGHKDRRVVQSAEDLTLVLLTSLQRLEERLQGETPLAFSLWNEIKTKGAVTVFRPKDEERLSDLVKRHFQEDLRTSGVVVNREVQIRQGAGSGTGEDTDIHVDAVVPNSADSKTEIISIIVETKGCWNPDLKSQMETQLVNRYLKDNDVAHGGLYLVGWYNCKQWDRKDYRWKQAPKISINRARHMFHEQAKELADNKRSVRAFVLNVALR